MTSVGTRLDGFNIGDWFASCLLSYAKNLSKQANLCWRDDTDQRQTGVTRARASNAAKSPLPCR